MNVNVPEKIYLQVCGDCPQTNCEDCKFEDLESNITWCKERIFPKDVEYIRTDAFIDKVADWLFHQANYYTKLKIDAHNGGVYTDFYADKMVEDFREYMKGE